MREPKKGGSQMAPAENQLEQALIAAQNGGAGTSGAVYILKYA